MLYITKENLSLILCLWLFLFRVLCKQDVENEGPEPSDWDRFAAEEYETLVAEESAQAQFQEGWVSLPGFVELFFNRGNCIRNIKTTLKNQTSNSYFWIS